MDFYTMEASFALIVIGTVLWILAMTMAVLRKMFGEFEVLGIIVGSFVLGVAGGSLSVYVMLGGWDRSYFIFYLGFWWLLLGVLMTLVPLWKWLRREVF